MIDIDKLFECKTVKCKDCSSQIIKFGRKPEDIWFNCPSDHFQPERSKREDVHYLKYELSEPNYGKSYHGVTFDKQDAENWWTSSHIRSYETHTSNKYAMRCSEHCGNAVRDK